MITDELEQRGWRMSERQASLFVKALVLGFALGRDHVVLADEKRVRWHVRSMFEEKRRRRR